MNRFDRRWLSIVCCSEVNDIDLLWIEVKRLLQTIAAYYKCYLSWHKIHLHMCNKIDSEGCPVHESVMLCTSFMIDSCSSCRCFVYIRFAVIFSSSKTRYQSMLRTSMPRTISSYKKQIFISPSPVLIGLRSKFLLSRYNSSYQKSLLFTIIIL